MIQTIQGGWLFELKQELQGTKCVRIISPFVTENMARLLLENFNGLKIQLITRYSLNDFCSGSSSISALKSLINDKAEIKGVKDLHSKLYLFDQKCSIITSANFTNGGFFRNKEFGIKSYSKNIIKESIGYYKELWSIDRNLLTKKNIEEWESLIAQAQNSNNNVESLPDFGKSYQEKVLGKGKRYFIKFFGSKDNRVNFDYHSRDEIREAHCHYALTFSRKKNDKRPRKYRDGDIVFMAMMLHGNDYAVFGKAVSLAHVDNRDIASVEDIKHVPWKKDWPILIRVHSSEFIDSIMKECPKMSELISELDYESFDKTLKRHDNGEENINPWRSLRQQADIQLSELGAMWLESRFKEKIMQFGAVPNTYVKQFYQGLEIV